MEGNTENDRVASPESVLIHSLQSHNLIDCGAWKLQIMIHLDCLVEWTCLSRHFDGNKPIEEL